MPRSNRVAPPGIVFHVLNRGNGRQRIFDDDADYAAFERVMAEALAVDPVRLLAYALMPNHWHLLLTPTAEGQLGRFMQRLTVTHVRRWHAHRHSAGQGHLYQGTYKSFPVQDDVHFRAVARYVERNPLRAGLVARAEQWRWGSLWRRQSGSAEDRMILAEWPTARPGDWLNWVNRPQSAAEEAAIRQCVTRGRPYGQEAWQRQTAETLGLGHTFRERGRPRTQAEPS
jgi:putative transposase